MIGGGGRVLYRADWTSARNVESFLERHETVRTHRPRGGGISPYLSEQIEYRDSDPEVFYAHLKRNGPRSYDEFKRAEQIWDNRDR